MELTRCLFLQFNEEARSPFVKKYKTIIHPGEVRPFCFCFCCCYSLFNYAVAIIFYLSYLACMFLTIFSLCLDYFSSYLYQLLHLLNFMFSDANLSVFPSWSFKSCVLACMPSFILFTTCCFMCKLNSWCIILASLFYIQVNRIRELPQDSRIIATHTDSPDVHSGLQTVA
jgi:hypothetical protein